MSSQSEITPQWLWDITVRGKWIILGALILSLSVAYVWFRLTPKSYKSSTTILVESQKIPENYVRGVVAGTVTERLSMIQQIVLSRTMLRRVMEELNLYKAEVRDEGLEAVVEKLRKDIEIKTVGNRSVEAFTISFLHENPMTAMKVTSKLASQYIEENLKVREQLVEGASEFLTQELAKAKIELEDKEKKISEFRAKYTGELPTQLEPNLRTLDRLQSEMTSSQEILQRLNDRATQTDLAIREYQETGRSSDDTHRSKGDPGDLSLKDLERNLAAMRAEYKETYPDIVMLKERIRKLKEHNKEGAVAADDTEPSSPGIDPYLAGLRRNRLETKKEIGVVKERQIRIQNSIKELENRVERTPQREQEYLNLLRDYENLQNNYRSLVDKNLSARVAGNLEKRQKGEQFRIIDPANLPHKAEKPDLMRFMLIGFAAGCALGFGYAIAREQLKPVFRRADEVEALLELPVIAEIPAMRFAYRAKATKFLPGRTGHQGLALPYVAPPLDAQVSTGAGNGKKRTRMEWRKLIPKWRHVSNGNGRYSKKRGAAERDFPRQFALIAKWSPTSVVAEQFRVAVTKLVLMFSEIPCPVVEVTSSVKGEGKSATAANLAYTLARDLAKRTLLIDCDFKSPTLHEYLEVALEPGLTEMMNQGRSLGECLVPINGVPLWVLPGGNSQGRMVELSKAPELLNMIAGLRGQFDYIVLDAPPILPLADMNVLSGLADGLLMVIRAGITPRRTVQSAIHRLKAPNQVALILNDIDAAVMPYYMRYEYRGQGQQPAGTLQ